MPKEVTTEPFRFKQFEVLQHRSSMKVGTDGVLLACWADVGAATQILDIGTGTGLIALVAAQRNSEAQVHGVDIDEASAQEAEENFKNSPFSKRLRATHADIFHWSESRLYNHILCNPPFFASGQSAGGSRGVARHQEQLTMDQLAESIAKRLSKRGAASIIGPPDQIDSFLDSAESHGLHLHRRCDVHPTPERPVKRSMVAVSPETCASLNTESLVIEKYGRHGYSEEYINLCKDFYLKM